MQDVGYYFCCHRRRRWDDWSHTIPQRTNCLFTAKRIALAIEVYWSKTKRSRSPLSHLPVFNHSMPCSRTFIVNPASNQRRADVRDCWFGIGGDHSLPAWYFLPESVIFRCTRPGWRPYRSEKADGSIAAYSSSWQLLLFVLEESLYSHHSWNTHVPM